MKKPFNAPSYSDQTRLAHHASDDSLRFYASSYAKVERNNINRESQQLDTIKERPNRCNVQTTQQITEKQRPFTTNIETMERARKLRHSNKKNVESHYVAANPLKKTNTHHFESHVLNNTSTVPNTTRTRNTKTYQSKVFDRDSQISRHSIDLDRESLQSVKVSQKSTRVRHNRTQSDLTGDPLKGGAAGFRQSMNFEERGSKLNFKKKMDPHVHGTDDIVTHTHGYEKFGTFFKRDDTINRNDKNKKGGDQKGEYDFLKHAEENVLFFN